MAVEVGGICGTGVLQIKKGRKTDILASVVVFFFFFPLAITFNEGPRGIFDFCMSSLLSACWNWKL